MMFTEDDETDERQESGGGINNVDILQERLAKKREELDDLEERIWNVEEQIRYREKQKRNNEQEDGSVDLSGRTKNQVEEVVNQVLEKLCFRLFHSINREPGSLEVNKTDLETTLLLEEIEDALRESVLRKDGHNAGSKPLLTIHRFTPEGSEQKLHVLVTRNQHFNTLASLAEKCWGISHRKAKYTLALVDDAGTTWPAKSLVFDYLNRHGQSPNLYLETLKPFDMQILQPKHLNPTLLSASQEGLPLAPILGEGVVELLKESSDGEGDKADKEPPLATRDPILSTRLFYLIDLLLMLVLFIIMAVNLAVENVAVEYKSSEKIKSIVDIQFKSSYVGKTDFLSIKNWDDMANFVREPFQIWLENTASGDQSRNQLIMPLRFRQNRVIWGNATDQSSDSPCPNLRVDPVTEYCFPAFSKHNQATTFFQGNSFSSTFQNSLKNMTEKSRNAFTFRENSWSLYDKLNFNFNTATSDSISGWDVEARRNFPSSGYILDIELKDDSSPPNIGEYFDAVESEAKERWIDLASRYVSLDVVFYNANFKTFIITVFEVTVDENGIFKSYFKVSSLIDIVNSQAFILLIANSVSVLLCCYICYTLVLRYRYIHQKCKAELLSLEEEQSYLTDPVGLDANLDGTVKVPIGKVALQFLFDTRTIVDILLIAVTLTSVVYSILPRWCGRYAALNPIPVRDKNFVSISILAQYVKFSRVAAAHAMAILLVKLHKYIPIKPYSNIEYGTAYYSFRRALFIGGTFLCILLAFGLASQLGYPGSTPTALYIDKFAFWIMFSFSSSLHTVSPNDTIFSEILVFIFVILVEGLLLKFLFGVCEQGRQTVASERARLSPEQRPSASADSWDFFADMLRRWYRYSKLGHPNF